MSFSTTITRLKPNTDEFLKRRGSMKFRPLENLSPEECEILEDIQSSYDKSNTVTPGELDFLMRILMNKSTASHPRLMSMKPGMILKEVVKLKSIKR